MIESILTFIQLEREQIFYVLLLLIAGWIFPVLKQKRKGFAYALLSSAMVALLLSFIAFPGSSLDVARKVLFLGLFIMAWVAWRILYSSEIAKEKNKAKVLFLTLVLLLVLPAISSLIHIVQQHRSPLGDKSIDIAGIVAQCSNAENPIFCIEKASLDKNDMSLCVAIPDIFGSPSVRDGCINDRLVESSQPITQCKALITAGSLELKICEDKLATRYNNSTYCNTEDCKATIAMQTNNSELCNRLLPADSGLPSLCRAVVTNNAVACEAIKGGWRNVCFKDIAIRTNNSDICAQIPTNTSWRALCDAKVSHNPAFCTMKDQSDTNFCYFSLSMLTKDASLCENIKFTEQRKACVALAKRDVALCEKISSEDSLYYKHDCRTSLMQLRQGGVKLIDGSFVE